MTMSSGWVYRLACDTCEQLGGPGDAIALGYLRADDVDGFMASHDGHRLSLVRADMVDQPRSRPDWTPRPLYGPPLPGQAQDVVCPLCAAFGGSDPSATTPIWKRTTAGEPLVFCRACGYTWGPGADTERSRMMLRSMGEAR